MNSRRIRFGNALLVPLSAVVLLAGCHALPITGFVKTDSEARVSGQIQAALDVRIPPAPDPGPMIAVAARPGPPGGCSSRVALIDVDGLLVNQNLTGLYSVGENPVAAFREKLEAAARDPSVRSIVVRINSPGGGVTATDIMAEELRRFRDSTGKPAVACLMDLATGGGYYLAVGCDRIIAHPTTITGGVGALMNHYNLQDAMAQLNVLAEPIKAGELVDMGTVTAPISPEALQLLQEMADNFRDRFAARVAGRRPGMTAVDRGAIADGRVVTAAQALKLRMVDRLGYVDDAITEAEQLGGAGGSEVVLYRREGQPTRSIYGITPNIPAQGEIVPFSYPGLERSKLPTFLYLWQPDPTITKSGGR